MTNIFEEETPDLDETDEAQALPPLQYLASKAAAMLRISDQTLRLHEDDSGIEVPRVNKHGSPKTRQYTPDKVFEFAHWRRQKGLSKGLPVPPATIAFHNRKGGVGKTMMACEMACQYQLMGLKVLLIDLDMQANATLLFGYDTESEGESPEEEVQYFIGNLITLPPMFADKQPLGAVLKKPYGEYGPHLIPADHRVQDFEFALGNAPLRELQLAHWIARGRKKPSEALDLSEYDLILLDLPPSGATVVTTALMASDLCVIPVALDRFGYKGLSGLLNNLKNLQETLGVAPAPLMVANFFNKHRSRVRAILQGLKQKGYGEIMAKVGIRESELVPRTIARRAAPVSLSAPGEAMVKEDLYPLALAIIEALVERSKQQMEE